MECQKLNGTLEEEETPVCKVCFEEVDMVDDDGVCYACHLEGHGD